LVFVVVAMMPAAPSAAGDHAPEHLAVTPGGMTRMIAPVYATVVPYKSVARILGRLAE
jgi:hypothetical protein